MFIKRQWNIKIRNIKISIEIVKKITVDKIYQEVYYISIGEEEREYMSKKKEVYCSWMDDFLSDNNIAVYYQSREYIAVCYREGRIL